VKAFERIFLYTVLAILVFYVFLVDGNVESQVVIPEEIRAKSIAIVNDAGQEVVKLCVGLDDGEIYLRNKTGMTVVYMGTDEDDGVIVVNNRHGGTIGKLP